MNLLKIKARKKRAEGKKLFIPALSRGWAHDDERKEKIVYHHLECL
jgi:hypothetical protein